MFELPELKNIDYFDFEITTRCTLACKYCYLSVNNLSAPRCDMTDETVNDALDLCDRIIKARNGKCFRMFFYGGEPFCAFERMQYVVEKSKERKLNISFGVVTNGCTATEDQVKWCKENNFTPQRSCDGCPEAMQFNRPGMSEKYERELLWWGDHEKTRRVTVSPQTAPFMLKSLRYFHELGIAKGGAFIPDEYADWAPDQKQSLLNGFRDHAREFVDDYKKGHVWYSNQITKAANGLFQNQQSGAGCGAGKGLLGITYDGRVVPCHRFSREPDDSPMVAGTIKQWLDGTIKGFGADWTDRRIFITQKKELPQCESCCARLICSKGCYHCSWAVNHDLSKPTEINCLVNREMFNLILWIDKELRPIDPFWWRRPAGRYNPQQYKNTQSQNQNQGRCSHPQSNVPQNKPRGNVPQNKPRGNVPHS